MNRIVLIGNGFDLAHGFKTSFDDFANDYVKDAYAGKYYTDPNSLVQFNVKPRSTLPDTISNLQEVHELVKRGLKINRINLFLKNLMDLKPRWVDVEMHYFSQITQLLQAPFIDKNDLLSEQGVNQLVFINDSFEQLRRHFLAYLDQLFKDVQIPIMHDMMEIIASPLDHHQVRYPEETLLVNFNYTPTVSVYSRVLNMPHSPGMSKTEYVDIHGTLSDDLNPPILGFGDELDQRYQELENLNDNRLLKYAKSFGYFRSGNYKKLVKFLDTPFDLIMIGHSGGLSDRTLLNQMFESPNCKSVKLIHHKDENGYTELTYELSRQFIDKRSMRNTILDYDTLNLCPQLSSTKNMVEHLSS